MPHESFTRRNLPHWYVPAATHFITFRLADSLPQVVLDELRAEKEKLLRRRPAGQTIAQHRERVHKQMFARYDEHLANHREIHWLDDPRLAALVRRSLYFWNGKKYGLLAYCILPNHVHMLATPFDVAPVTEANYERMEVGESEDARSPLTVMMHSLKSYTAHEANKILGRTGSFWQRESYDHWVRDLDELERIVAYINANAVKAGLALRAHEFPWCSAHDRFLHDGDESGWLVFDT